jgi:hypothetical protein
LKLFGSRYINCMECEINFEELWHFSFNLLFLHYYHFIVIYFVNIH